MRIAIVTGFAAFAAAAVAQDRPAPDPASEAREADQRAAYYKLADTGGTGPYPAIREEDPGLPDHTVYRPERLAGLAKTKLGVLVWGNGGCREDGASARLHLTQIASYGYLTIAPGRNLSGAGKPPPPSDPGKGVRTTTKQVLEGIDWALAENSRKGSIYYGRIDPRMIAVAGHSCGGLQAIQAGADPRVRTLIVHNSGIFADGSNPIVGMVAEKGQLDALRTPVLYVLGGKGDVAWPNGTDDVARINHVPVVLIDGDVGHGGTFRERDGGDVARFSVAWLEWQLRGDKQAGRMFVGADCRLCSDPKWRIQRKGL